MAVDTVLKSQSQINGFNSEVKHDNTECDQDKLEKDAESNSDTAEKAETEEPEKKSQFSKKEKRRKTKENTKTKKNVATNINVEENDYLNQDVEFGVTIQPPTGSSFEIKVSTLELVQEIHQLLMDREDTCHRTCFCLMCDNTVLDNFSELKAIEGIKDGAVIRIVEQPYTVREARIHVRHVRDLLKSLDSTDSYNGAECASLSFLNVICRGDVLEKKRGGPDSVDCTPPDYILPGSTHRPLTPLQPFAKEQKNPKCLQELNLSPWNPPPGHRKLHGDLLYLYVLTNEGRQHYITASPSGFFINESTDAKFDPRPASPCYLSHSLIELLNQLSNTFKRNFSNLQKKRTSKHPFERVATPYQVYSWASPLLEHYVDSLRAEDAFSSKLGYEEHIPGQTRDWNEELQTTRELSRKSLPERLLRERAVFKVHSDFVSAATRGAVAVVNGNVMAINPGEDPTMQMFIWNNIFFSLGFDVKDHYKDLGGNAAAFVAPKNDLQGVRVYSNVDLEGLYTLGTVVVDYKGYRVAAQSIIPGILEKEQEQSVVYGSIDFGKTVVTHPKYMDLLQKAGQQLKIAPHTVLNEKNEEIELCSSIECKGIIGNDGRHYILDLLRTFPPDMNFLPLSGVELLEDSKKMGFPVAHKHKLATLRREFIESYVDGKYMLFFKLAAAQLQKLKSHKETNDGKDNKHLIESDNCNTDGRADEDTKEVVRKAAIAVGSLKETDFDIKFNPDVFSPLVKHANSNSESLKKAKELVIDAAEYIVLVCIPGVVRDLTDSVSNIMDSFSLCHVLHTRGVNLRYLGKVTELVALKSDKSAVHSVAVSEMIIRSVRHLFIEYIQNIETTYTATAVAHFLNCFLSSCHNPHPPISGDEVVNSRKKKRKSCFSTISQSEFASLHPRNLWQQIKLELRSYFCYTLQADSIDSVVEKYNIQKISLLRAFCLKCGIQVLLRDYSFDSKTQTFLDDDIMNLFPVAKHIHPKATDAANLFAEGQSRISNGALKEGLQLIAESLNLLNNVYGAMHIEISQCLRLLARISYILGEYADALSYQQRATFMSERVYGIDHHQTIQEYINLSLYCFATHQVSVSLKLLYRARYLILLNFGENHPEVALVDTNIGLILHAESQYVLSLKFLEKALQLTIRFHGKKSLKVALSYHLVARTQSCMGDFRSAMQYEKETYTIYNDQLGPNHDKTKEADECLLHLTQQAVVMARKMNEVISGKGVTGLPPIQIQNPSMANVLELLNVANGIVFISMTPSVIECLKRQMVSNRVEAMEREGVILPEHEELSGVLAKLAIEDANSQWDISKALYDYAVKNKRAQAVSDSEVGFTDASGEFR